MKMSTLKAAIIDLPFTPYKEAIITGLHFCNCYIIATNYTSEVFFLVKFYTSTIFTSIHEKENDAGHRTMVYKYQ
jgi:hypothetical protein